MNTTIHSSARALEAVNPSDNCNLNDYCSFIRAAKLF